MLVRRRRLRRAGRDLRRDHGRATRWRSASRRSTTAASSSRPASPPRPQAPRQARPAATRRPTGCATLLSSLKVLQDSQVKKAQTKLMQAGIRSKECAVAVIFGRLVLPIVLGGSSRHRGLRHRLFPDLGRRSRRYGARRRRPSSCATRRPTSVLKNKITKRTDAIRKGLPDALDLLVICAEAGLTVDAAFGRVAQRTGQGLSRARRRIRADRDRAGLPHRPPPGVREPRQRASISMRCTASSRP